MRRSSPDTPCTYAQREKALPAQSTRKARRSSPGLRLRPWPTVSFGALPRELEHAAVVVFGVTGNAPECLFATICREVAARHRPDAVVDCDHGFRRLVQRPAGQHRAVLPVAYRDDDVPLVSLSEGLLRLSRGVPRKQPLDGALGVCRGAHEECTDEYEACDQAPRLRGSIGSPATVRAGPRREDGSAARLRYRRGALHR